MKNYLILFALLYSCSSLPTGSNIRTATVRDVKHDSVQFFGNKRYYILTNDKVQIGEKIQFTVIKLSTDTSLCKIKKL